MSKLKHVSARVTQVMNSDDSDIVVVERVPIFDRKIKTARSLKPDEAVMNACCQNPPAEWATLIRDSWAFRFPLRTMTKTELEELSDRCSTTFNCAVSK